MAKLKIGRKIFEITENDIVLYNGACWQLITQKIFSGFHDHSLTMSKTMCEKFIKKDILLLYKKENEYTTLDGRQMGLYYYKFDINKLNEQIVSEGACVKEAVKKFIKEKQSMKDFCRTGIKVLLMKR